MCGYTSYHCENGDKFEITENRQEQDKKKHDQTNMVRDV